MQWINLIFLICIEIKVERELGYAFLETFMTGLRHSYDDTLK